MRYKELRVRLPEDIYDRFREVCDNLSLSRPKQTREIVRKFVEVQEDNMARLKEGK